MPIKTLITKGLHPVKIWTDVVEHEAYEQLVNLSNLPFIHDHVAVMPDVHAGKGSTVGTVIATDGAIVPAAVGVDIGCGMAAVKLDVDISQLNLAELREKIEAQIPVGFNDNGSRHTDGVRNWSGWNENIPFLKDAELYTRAKAQLGSLGGGNHFIELCLDTDGGVWVMLHSGSRGIGNKMASKHMKIAKQLNGEGLVDKDLAHLTEGTQEFSDYMRDLDWCQRYAWENREEMIRRVLRVLGFPKELFRVHCHHNYTSKETWYGKEIWVTRKGAIKVSKGSYGIVPGSMGTRSYIVEGLGNQDAFDSCSHGAGRKMSRSAAKRQFTLADLEAQTNGVECRKDVAVIDEIPGSYKDIDEVMKNEEDLVKPIHILKQVLCIKG